MDHPEVTRTDSAPAGEVFRVVRCDAPDGWGANVQRTPQGGAKIRAVLGRPGVLLYDTPTGPVREWRPASVVNDPVSLAMLDNAPIVADHPTDGEGPMKGLVTPQNYERHAKGNIAAGSVVVENGLPTADLVILSGQLLDEIARGERN